MPGNDVQTVTLPQGRIAYRDSGSGDPVLLVHGWPLSSLTWRKVVPALESTCRCIAIDLMGAGETKASLDGDFSMPAQARMLADFLDALDLPSATLIAQDSGATIARILAADQPQRVPRLVIFDTEVPGHVISRFVLLQRLLRLPGSVPLFEKLLRSRAILRSRPVFGTVARDRSALDLDELLDIATEPILRSRDHVRASLKFFAEFDWHVVDALPHDRLTMPKLVLWGDHDTFFPIARGHQLFETLPEPKSFSTIADCGVLPHEERPAEWLAAVQPFLAEKSP